MFDFLSMMDNYESRKVANDIINDAVIDTAAVNDSRQPYETAIRHPDYNDGKWIIVELYPTRKAAAEGHKRWVERFASGLPKHLADVNSCDLGMFVRGPIFIKKEKDEKKKISLRSFEGTKNTHR